jgi:UPF0755 protein
MKKIIFLGILLALAIIAYIGYTRFLAPATAFDSKEKFLYIPTKGANKNNVLDSLNANNIVNNVKNFDWLAEKLKYWTSIKPGKYKIEKDMSLMEMVKLLRSGKQTPSRLVFNKLRLRQDFARVIARAIESDSAAVMAFLSNPDSLKTFDLTEENWSAYVIPDTYEVYWTWGIGRTLDKLLDDRENWWNKKDRKALAEKKGLTPEKVHIIASIVEEETNNADDKPLVASVYLNRIKRGMPLQADPTVRFAMKDFKSNRVLYSHLRTPSPYNTYMNAGLPPGPICTPTQATLDAVLNAPDTEYIFFVAKADLKGGSTFTSTLAEHNRAAKVYQDSLTAWQKRKAARQKAAKDSLDRLQKNG